MKHVVVGMLAAGLCLPLSSLNSAEAAVMGGKPITVKAPKKTPKATTPQKAEPRRKDEFRFSRDTLPYFSPKVDPYWVSYERWTAYWWQWAYSAPVAQNPLVDTTGENCAVGQHGPVWFLAGFFGTPPENPLTRTCDIPQDRAILFPVINIATDNSYPEGSPGDLYKSDGLREIIKPFMDAATNLEVKLNGNAIPFIKEKFRFQSPVYSNTLPPKNIWEFFGLTLKPGIIHPSVADGYFVMLKPLRPGIHTLEFKGEVPGVFSQNIKYTLRVCKLKDVARLDPRTCP